jgi:hypothetical protein
MNGLTRGITQLVVAAGMAGAVLAGTAWAQEPPAEPDVSAMAVGVADLPDGATVIDEGPVKLPGASAAYERTFDLPPRAARVAGFVMLDSSVALCPDAAEASSLFAAIRHQLGSARGRRSFARSMAAALEIPVRRVKVGRLRTLRVGDEAFALPVAVTMAHVKLRQVTAFARVDRVIAEITADGFGRAASLMKHTRSTLEVSVEHIRAALTTPPTAAAVSQP